MKLGIFFLMLGYGLSQFYRSFLAVLSPALAEDLGASAADLSYASGIWFLVFAAAQLPIGVALDRYGPRWISVILVAIGGGGGGVMMALAHTPQDITLAMAFLGLGGAPVLMAAYFIFARAYP
ncbi:MAG: MFS transporter, partial [Paracoccaceae bacterium]|nr:MFS transporter [Paracoccaceae bacterium]